MVWATRRELAPVWHRFTAGAAAWKKHLELLRIGLPIGLHLTAEIGFLLIVAVLMGRIGDTVLAGHQIALSLASISFMVPLGSPAPPRRGSVTPSPGATWAGRGARPGSAWRPRCFRSLAARG